MLREEKVTKQLENILRGYVGEEVELLGVEEKKPRGYWQNLDNVVGMIKTVMEKHGFDTIPSYEALQRFGYLTIAYAINMHGGFTKFRKMFGETGFKSKEGEWPDLETVLDKITSFNEEHGYDTLPSKKIIANTGNNRLVSEIKHHGGFHVIRESLGEEQKILKRDTWKNLGFTKKESIEFMKKHNLKSLPGGKKICELGGGGLYSAIVTYHGGMRKFRGIIGQEQIQREKGIWKDIEYVKDEAKNIMDEHGFNVLPGARILTGLGYNAFIASINGYHGGMRKFRELLGQEQVIRKQGVWKDIDYLIREVRAYLIEKGYKKFPSLNTFRNEGRHDLANAFYQHGGLITIKKLMGYSAIDHARKIESLLGDYVEGEKDE